MALDQQTLIFSEDNVNPISYSPAGYSQKVEHVYRMEWLPNGVVKWHVDNTLYRTVIATTPTPSNGLPGGAGSPDGAVESPCLAMAASWDP